MPIPKVSRNLIILHATVFVWGFTGILGALISINATQLVWFRVLIAAVSLLVYFKIKKINIKVTRSVFFKLFFTGAIVGAHWILFFQSIKSSTVSVALVCISSITLFTAILEPIVKKVKISWLEILTGICIIIGIILIFKFETRYTLGIIYGLACAVCASVFSIINSQQVQNRPAPIISFYELVGAWFWISCFMLVTDGFSSQMMIGYSDIFYLLILGTVCTSVAYVAGVSVMKELSAFKVALVTNLEPVYGILLAWMVFGKQEKMSIGFYLGSLIVLSAVFIFPVIKNKIVNRKNASKNTGII